MSEREYPPEAWQRLGRLAKVRRKELRWIQADLQGVGGGPSGSVVSKIENGHGSRYDVGVFIRLEDALGWRRGSVDAILSGGDPTLADDPNDDEMPSPRRHLEALQGGGESHKPPGQAFEEQIQAFKDAIDRGDEPPAPPGGFMNDGERDIWDAKSIPPWRRWQAIEFLRAKDREALASIDATLDGLRRSENE
jgi:hypothetical protein